MTWIKFFQPKKNLKKVTLSFPLSSRPYSHRPYARGVKAILATYFFAEELLCPWFQWNFTVARIALVCLFPGSGCKKHLKIKETRNYSFKTIGFCPRTKVKSPLILRRFYATWPRVLFYSLPQSVSLSFRRVGKGRVNEVVFSAALELNLVKYFPILQKTAIQQSPQTNTAT